MQTTRERLLLYLYIDIFHDFLLVVHSIASSFIAIKHSTKHKKQVINGD